MGSETLEFREAREGDLPAILAMLRDDRLGATREGAPDAAYRAAFARLLAEPDNHVILGEMGGAPVATYQITFITGLTLGAARRAQIESVRVASNMRGHGIGARMIDDAAARARAAGCSLMQLTTNASRADARAFYERLGFTPSHIGFKRELSAAE
ncbi:GNAT family N-acetyltransferase [Alkalilacustris brevis]|uniref:GNAT family N-acetyltransferase n=1 Tax=Alkalilacustris brevis TaxID=2026338 RepID=UPI000E0DEA1F|nr:GNAT family N-acetyltransferase [Alkalilacustris brevis]